MLWKQEGSDELKAAKYLKAMEDIGRKKQKKIEIREGRVFNVRIRS